MKQKVPVNNEILRLGITKVRVVDAQGKNLGIMDTKDALKLAQEQGLDLVSITDKVDPPVCKIIDYGKYLYQEEKKKRQQKPQKGEMKTIRLGFNISLHDMEIRANNVERFLKEGHRIFIEMPLRGREKMLKEFAKEKFNSFLNLLTEKGMSYKIERELKLEPRGLTIILSKK